MLMITRHLQGALQKQKRQNLFRQELQNEQDEQQED
jgi:hypothetical protein